MPLRKPSATALLLLALLAAGCNGDDGSGREKASTETQEATSTHQATAPAREPSARELRRQAAERRRRARREAAGRRRDGERDLEREHAARKREAARDRQQDRELDRSFEGTPLDKVLSRLPIGEPPLYVRQYLTFEGSHRVYTAVAPKRFFCGKTPARRKAAVTAFYRDADRRFRRAGIDDFVQVVTPVGGSAGELPALAVGRRGAVSLTARGRAKGPC